MITFRRPMGAAPLMPSGVEHTDENILAQMLLLKHWPVLVSDKIDGIRGIRLNGSLLSKTRHKIPNKLVVERALVMPGGFDVECAGSLMTYNETQSVVMRDGHPLFDTVNFHVIDWFGKEGGYLQRCNEIARVIKDMPPCVKWTMPTLIETPYALFDYFNAVEITGGEGICFRTINSPYKQGRSTLREQWLVKLARYVYAEGIITGFEEQLANCNDDKHNDVGYMKRSTSAANMVGKKTVGTVILTDTLGATIRCGTGEGLTADLRQDMWNHPNRYLNKQYTYKHKPVGRKDAPRQAILVGPRKEGY